MARSHPQAWGVAGTPSNGGATAVVADSISSDGAILAAISGEPRWERVPIDRAAYATDAAALAAAFTAAGTRVFATLRGRFSLALFDRGSGMACLALDRMGIERIAWACRDGLLHFSSDAHEIARRLDGGARVELQGLHSYLFFHMVPSPATIFRGVSKLPPAHFAAFGPGKEPIVEAFWVPGFQSEARASERELASQLHTVLGNAVSRSCSGEDSGAFLSGGLDSSTVAGLLSRCSPATRAKTFSMGFGDNDYDELRYARIAAQRFNLDAREYVVGSHDVVTHFRALAAAFDEPFGNSSALPTLVCARFAREQGIAHLLAGDGGDELFAGNERYSKQKIFDAYWSAPAFARAALESMAERMDDVALLRVWPVRKAMRYVIQARVPLPRRLETWNLLEDLGAARLLQPEFLEAVDLDAPFRHMEDVYRRVPSGSVVDRLLAYDWAITLADNDLRKVSGACELAGIRVSYPMLDDDVVDFSLQIPASMKMHGTELRSFYKRAMAGFLPPEIITKKKHGFGLPFGYWLQEEGPLRDMVFDLISSLRGRRIFNDALLDELPKLNSGSDARYYGVLIWVLAMLEAWLQEHRLSV